MLSFPWRARSAFLSAFSRFFLSFRSFFVSDFFSSLSNFLMSFHVESGGKPRDSMASTSLSASFSGLSSSTPLPPMNGNHYPNLPMIAKTRMVALGNMEPGFRRNAHGCPHGTKMRSKSTQMQFQTTQVHPWSTGDSKDIPKFSKCTPRKPKRN